MPDPEDIVPNAELPAVAPVAEPPPVQTVTPNAIPATVPIWQRQPPPAVPPPGVAAPELLPAPTEPADTRDDLTKAFDARMDAYAYQRETILKTSMADALKDDPTKMAKVLALSAASGIAPELVRDNFDTVEHAVNFRNANLPAMQTAHPELSQWLSDRSNAAVGHDDIEALKRISFVGQAVAAPDAATMLLPPGFIFSGGKIVEPLPDGQSKTFDTYHDFAREMHIRGMIAEGHEGEIAEQAAVLQSRFGWAGANLISGAAGALLPMASLVPGARVDPGEQEDFQRAAQSLAPGFGGTLVRGAGALVGGLPLLAMGGPTAELGGLLGEAKATQLLLSRVVGQRAAAFIGKESLPSMGAFVPMALPGAIQTAQDKGLGAGALDFFINDVVPGAMGLGPVARAILPGEVAVATGYRSVADQILKGAGFQAAQGMAPALATMLANRAGGDTHAFDNLVPELAAQGLLGAGAGALFSLHPALANKVHAEHLANVQALNWGDHLKLWVDGLKDSAVTERTPERMAQYTAEFIKRGAPEAVFMQADDWAAAHPEQDPLKAAEAVGLGQDYATAKTLGTDLKVPLATFLQAAAASEKPEAFTHAAKQAPEAPRPIDAAKGIVALPEQIAEAQRLAGEQAKKAEPQTIREEVAGQLKEATQHPRIVAPAAKLVSRGLERIAAMFNEGAAERGAKPITAIDLYREFKLEIEKGAPDFFREIITPEHLNALLDKVRAGTAPKEAVDALRQLGVDVGQHPTNDTAKAALAEALGTKRNAGATLEQAPRIEAQGKDLDFDRLLFQWKKAIGDRSMSPKKNAWRKMQEAAALKNSEPAAEMMAIARQDLKHLSDKARRWVETLGLKDRTLLYDSIEHLATAPDKGGDLVNLKWILDIAKRPPKAPRMEQAAEPQTESTPFKNWFGDSKAVDESGKPLVVYHGTNQPIETFSKVRRGQNTGSVSSKVAFFFTEHPVEADEYAAMSARHQLPNAVEREATSKRLMKELEQAARRRDFDLEEKLNRQLEENELKDRYDGPMGQAVMPVYLRVTNPLVVDFKGSVDLHLMTSKIDEAKASGHDGLKMLNVYDAVAERPEKFTTTQWAVFEPKQIKSATGNSGAFSDKTANILKQGANADIALGESKAVVRLFQTEDPSSFLHESGHYFLEMFARVAEREDAPAAMKADLAGVLEWAGYGDRATMVRTQQEVADLQAKIGEREPTEAERAKLIELSKPHENFARGFEQYLREGRAPAQGLRGAFAKIKEWMLAVYKAVKDLVTLTPQMRDFFDRLLASEEEIAKAKERVGDEPLFKGPDDFPGKPEEFAAYQKTVQAARDSQEQALERHLMRASLEERSDLYKAERVRVREGFDTQVGDQPEFKALSALQDGELPNGDPLPKDLQGIKLDKQVLDHDYTPEELARLPGPGKDVNRGKAVYAREGGWLPETAAAHFGFRSGDELVRALMDAPDRATLVDQLTDEHMAREHPDAMKDKALLEQLASESLATDKAGDLLEDELKHLALKVGQNAQLRQVYRVAAQSKISEQSERELAPNQYRQGEAKAAREQHAALAKGDFAGALEAGKRRLMNRELFKAASEARADAQDIAKNQRRFDEPRVQRAIGKAGGLEWTVRKPDGSVEVMDSQEAARDFARQNPGSTYDRSSSYLDQIQKLRERFSFRNETAADLDRRMSLFQFLERIEYYTDPETGEKVPLGPHPIISDALRDEAYKRNWRDLPISQLRDVNDAIASIEKTAMWRNKALKATAALHVDELIRIAVDTIDTNKQRTLKPTKVGVGPADFRTVLDAKDSLIQIPRIVHEMDGFKHGGKMWEVWQRPQDEALTQRTLLDEANTEALHAASKEWGHGFGANIRHYDADLKMQISRWGRIMLLLHYGNKEGRQRVTAGYGWSPEQVEAALGKLDAKDIRFAERIVDTLNSHWSDVKAQYEKLNGVAPPKVEAVPVELPAGTYKGGYMRLYYDRDSMVGYNHMGADEAKQALQGTRMTMHTRNGYTKERAKTLEGAKPSLDPMDVPRALREVTHDLTHREMLMDLSRVLANKDFQGAVSTTWGPGVLRQFKYQLQGVAAGNQPPSIVLGKMLEGMRQKMNFAARAFRPIKALEQIAGLPLAIPQIGAGHFAKAVVQRFWSAVTFDRTTHAIESESPMMRQRGKLINRSPQDVFGQTGLEGPIAKVMNAGGYFLWSKTFAIMDEVVWLAAKNRALSEGRDHATAVAIADRTVKSTMGSGEQTDIAQVQRGGPLGQIITANMSWAITNYGMLAEAANQAGYGFRKGDWEHIGKGLGSLVFLGIVGPALYEYSRDLLYGEDASDWYTPKGLAKETALAGVTSLLGSLPLGRDLAGAATEGQHYSGPAGMREMNVLGSFLTSLHAEHYSEATAKAAVGAASLTLPIPAAAIFQIYDAVKGAKEQRQTPGQTLRSLLLGAPQAKR